MSTGDVRRSQSANFFKTTTRRNEEDINQRPKRLRVENPTTTDILIDAPSTSTLVEENVNNNLTLLVPQNHDEKTSNYLAIKLNRLKDKQVRFESHKDFLSRCINEGLVPKGLELMLEPTIGNHDQNFLDNWYSKLKQFSLTLMDDIVKFCDKTISETKTEINKAETTLKSNTNQEQFKAIKNEIQNNEETAKKMLQQKKFKKFNNLKYKPKVTNQPNSQQASDTHEQPKKLYSDILRRKKSNTTVTKKSSETNIQPNKPDTIQKLKALNIRKTKGKQPSRSNSSTNQTEEESLKLQVEQLKQELQHLKNETNKQENNNNKVTFNEQPQYSKNEEQASTTNGGRQQQNVEIISVISYIEETMKTLKDFGEQLRIQLNTNPTH